MKIQRSCRIRPDATVIRGGFNPRTLLTVVVCGVAACSMVSGTPFALFRPEASSESERTLTFEERVSYQRAIEEVYWRHRIWPKERRDSKPSLDAVMTPAQLEKKVANYLRNSEALDYWQRPIIGEQLQTEMDRMAQHTKQPEVLRELFEALGNDPFVIAECLVRPALSERLVTKFYAHEPEKGPLESSRATAQEQQSEAMETYVLPTISGAASDCTDDTWTPTSIINAPDGRLLDTGAWTGSEMIVWGGINQSGNNLDTGGRYSPATDSWTATSTSNAPAGRVNHTAVWTGTEMIVWGGSGDSGELNTGGKYNPATDSWAATSTTNAPSGRQFPKAVWTGSEIIVWGGLENGCCVFNTGGRYSPNTDTWTATSIINAPDARAGHTAVWTGSEMIVWGGYAGRFNFFNTGGRYNPTTDSWTATSTTNVPSARALHTAVWSDSEMIVWGGGADGSGFFNTGGRYNPITDTWTVTSITNAPSARYAHTAVWSGNEMIVWGGNDDTGGRYNPITNIWIATSTTNAPAARGGHTAVWTGAEMIVLGGSYLNTGGRYCAESGPTPTPSPRPSLTPRPRPTVHPRPTL